MRSPATTFSSWLVLLWLACAMGVSVAAQDEAAVTAPVQFSTELIRTQLQAIEANRDLDEKLRTQVANTLREALVEVEAIETLEQSLAERNTEIEEIQPRQQTAEAERAGLPSEYIPPPTEELSQEQLDAKVRETQQAFEQAQNELTKLQAESKRRQARRLDIPQLTATVQEELREINSRISQPPAADTPSQLSEAETLRLMARQRRVQRTIDSLAQELKLYNEAEDLLALQIAAAQQKRKLLEQELSFWTGAAASKRKSTAETEAKNAQTKVAEVPPELAELANENLTKVQTQEELAVKIHDASQRLTVVKKQLDEWNSSFDEVYTQLAPQVAISESIGLDLRNRRGQLPDPGPLHRELKTIRRQIFDIRFQQMTNDAELLRLSKIDEAVEEQLRLLPASLSDGRTEQLKPEVQGLLEDQRETRTRLRADFKTYLDTLVKLNVELDRLINLVEKYESFIDERVLWIPSAPPIRLSDVASVKKSLAWFSSTAEWRDLWTVFTTSLRQPWQAVVSALVLFCLTTLFYTRSSSLKLLSNLGDRASSKTCRSFSITLRALLITIVLAAPWVLLLFWASWILYSGVAFAQSNLVRQGVAALFSAACSLAPLAFWKQTVRRSGLAESHFDWRDHPLRVVRRELIWIPWIIVPVAALNRAFLTSGNQLWDQPISRLFMITLWVIVLVVLARAFSPRKGLPYEYLGLHRDGWVDKLRYFWYALILMLPLALLSLTLFGYIYTVSQLGACLYFSIVFLSFVWVVRALILRWVLLNRRRLAIVQARERLAAVSASVGSKLPTETGDSSLAEPDLVDLTTVNQQTQRLVTSFAWFAAFVGVYLIWIDVLPALSRLNQVHVWQTDVVVSAAPEAPSSGTGGEPTETAVAPPTVKYEWITLGDLLGAFLIITMTLVAIGNIPGLLEIAVLQHLPLDTALRYAITTVTRYLIIITGVSWALTTLDFGWSKIQWLLAAISVGLGFGLQEIFANFVSGLILLFERPLRAGDIVTVGNVTGKVLQIKTRATTIQDWDRKELVVPNKEFITSQLLNWTLVDQVNRLVIPVGVAYGTDIAKARAILLQIAKEHPLVMQDPEPSVTFDLFGDSALNLTLRLHLAQMDHRLTVTHDLHEAIHRRFAEEGIQIPFPQRDLHIHSADLVRQPLKEGAGEAARGVPERPE